MDTQGGVFSGIGKKFYIRCKSRENSEAMQDLLTSHTASEFSFISGTTRSAYSAELVLSPSRP